MHTVEDAYQKLASYIIAFVGDRSWESAGCKLLIHSRMASGSQWLLSGGMRDETGGFEGGEDALWAGLDAALFIRNDLLSTTGRRIWGLMFTLYPDGKFQIDFDYKAPDDYEETNETVDV